MIEVYIQGTGTAVPKNTFDQSSISEVVEALFSDTVHDLHRLLEVFKHTHIKRRHLIRDPEWYATDHSFSEANAAYVLEATSLSIESAEKAIAVSGLSSNDIAGIVVASTTGLMTPSLDAVLTQRLALRQTITRLPIFGLGCAGGWPWRRI